HCEVARRRSVGRGLAAETTPGDNAPQRDAGVMNRPARPRRAAAIPRPRRGRALPAGGIRTMLRLAALLALVVLLPLPVAAAQTGGEKPDAEPEEPIKRAGDGRTCGA